jgi:hypothetical protein
MRVNGERWAAASGYVVVLFGVAGAAFERGGPPLNAPVDQTIAFFSTYRSELLSQSLMFVWSASAYLWFFGVLRTFLLRDVDRSRRRRWTTRAWRDAHLGPVCDLTAVAGGNHDGDGREVRPAAPLRSRESRRITPTVSDRRVVRFRGVVPPAP